MPTNYQPEVLISIFNRIRREGHKWNRKRVLRVYRNMELKLRRKHKKRLAARVKHPLEAPVSLNICWSMDFMSDVLSDGKKARVLNVLDDCNREVLLAEAGFSFLARAVVEALAQLKEEIGAPKYIRCDNSPEFLSKTIAHWCERNFIKIKYIQP